MIYEILFVISQLMYEYMLSTVQLVESRLIVVFYSQVKEAMQRIHDRGNIGKLILDVEKSPTPLVTVLMCFFRVNCRNEVIKKLTSINGAVK